MYSRHLLRDSAPTPAAVVRITRCTLALVAVLAFMVAGAVVTVQAQTGDIVKAVVKSPVTADGNVAGHPTDINVFLDKSFDPQVPGYALLKGHTIKVTLPEGFQRNPAVEVNSHDQGLLVLGWPQADVKSDYSVGLEGERTVVFTANEDILPQGPGAPGIKALHVRGSAFTNPPAGDYTVTVTAEVGQNGEAATGTGTLTILPAIQPSINITNLLFGRPSNNNFQRVPVNSDVPIPLDFLLFDQDGKRDDGVGLAPPDRALFPQYPGGLLIRDTNHDGLLNSSGGDTVIGGIKPAAPAGATGQKASPAVETTLADLDTGKPKLSGTIENKQGDKVPGVMRVLFHTGDKQGLYQPTFELIGGNSVQVTIIAEAPGGGANPPGTVPGMPTTGAAQVGLWLLAVVAGLLLAGAGLRLRQLGDR